MHWSINTSLANEEVMVDDGHVVLGQLYIYVCLVFPKKRPVLWEPIPNCSMSASFYAMFSRRTYLYIRSSEIGGGDE